MNLHEYQAKHLFADYDLPVPQGIVCHSPDEARQAAVQLGKAPWVIKCQVHAGGRGKAGGVRLIDSAQAAYDFAANWLGQHLRTTQTTAKGQLVQAVLIEPVTPIAKELYLSVILDRQRQRIVVMASTEGGMDIETVAKTMPENIFRVELDPLTGPQPFQARQLAYQLGLQKQQIMPFTTLFLGIARLFVEKDLNLLEINPLAITEAGDLLCLDAKVSVDNNALYRQPDLKALYDVTQDDAMEAHAAQYGLSYVALEGNIGCLVNGAGLAMATMDMVKLYGGSPANFLDVGGSATKERVTEAFKIIMSDPQVNAVFVNIFGGIVRCDLIAEGIISAVEEIGIHIPIVVRLEGNQAQQGAEKLARSGCNIISEIDLQAAAQKVVSVAAEETL